MSSNFTFVCRIGYRSGKLTCVENLIPSDGARNRGGLWKCVCDCGKERALKGYDLREGKKAPLSCGCMNAELQVKKSFLHRKYSETTKHHYYCGHRNEARGRGSEPIPKEQWLKIVSAPCFYCGEIETRSVVKVNRTAEVYKRMSPEELLKYEVKMNGVDRIDSSKGYEIENCRSCCGMCNWMKSDYTQEEFFRKISLIHNKNNL